MSIYKLRGAYTGDVENDIAALDIQFDGDITGMHMANRPEMDADTEESNVEISFLSSNTIGSNDARGSLLTSVSEMYMLTSGASNNSHNSSIGGIRVPVSAGERIHMHSSGSTGVTGVCHAYIYVDDTADESLRRRR